MFCDCARALSLSLSLSHTHTHTHTHTHSGLLPEVFLGGAAQSPLKPAWDRVLQIGDASGIQSPLSFGGFGAMTRHLARLRKAVIEALEVDPWASGIVLIARQCLRIHLVGMASHTGDPPGAPYGTGTRAGDQH